MLRKFSIFSLGLLFFLTSYSQKFSFQETEEFKGDGILHAYPFVLHDGNYTVVYGAYNYFFLDPIFFHPQVLRFLDKSYLVRFSKDLKKTNETRIEELNGTTKAEGFVSNGKKIFALTGMDKGSTVSVSEFDPTSAKLIGSNQLLSGLPKKHPLFHSTSPDGKLFAISTPNEVGKRENQSYQVGIFDDNGKVKVNYTFSINCPKGDLDDQFFVLNDAGELYCVFLNNGKNITYRLVSCTASGKIKGETILGTGNGYEMLFDFRVVNNNIQYQGIKAESSKKGITAFLAGAVDQATMKSLWLKETPISALPFRNVEVSNNYKNFFRDGISNQLDFVESRSLSDGSRISILEMNFERRVQSYYDNDISKPSFSVKKYNTGDLIVINHNTQGDINWVNAISKRQEEADLNAYVSLVSAVDEKDGLSIFFHDHVDNQDVFTNGRVKEARVGKPKDYSLASVYLTKDGQVKKTFVANNEAKETYFSPRSSYFVKNGSLFYLEIRIKTFKGVYYRMGIMKITPK